MQCHVIAKPQIRGRIVLVLLAHLAERTVPLEPQRHDLADIDTCPGPWLELPLVFGTRKIMLERGIGEQLQRAKAPFEDRRQLGGTGALAERRPRRMPRVSSAAKRHWPWVGATVPAKLLVPRLA